MSIHLSEEERMIQKTARDFARKDIAAVVDEANREGVFHDEIYGKLAELGFMGMTMPEEYRRSRVQQPEPGSHSGGDKPGLSLDSYRGLGP